MLEIHKRFLAKEIHKTKKILDPQNQIGSSLDHAKFHENSSLCVILDTDKNQQLILVLCLIRPCLRTVQAAHLQHFRITAGGCGPTS